MGRDNEVDLKFRVYRLVAIRVEPKQVFRTNIVGMPAPVPKIKRAAGTVRTIRNIYYAHAVRGYYLSKDPACSGQCSSSYVN